MTEVSERSQFNFMAVLTLVLVVTVQVASVIGLVMEQLAFREYLAVWSPLLGVAIGYWFRSMQS